MSVTSPAVPSLTKPEQAVLPEVARELRTLLIEWKDVKNCNNISLIDNFATRLHRLTLNYGDFKPIKVYSEDLQEKVLDFDVAGISEILLQFEVLCQHIFDQEALLLEKADN